MRPLAMSVAGLAVLAFGTADAQLTDLQPGRNFPVAQQQFGANRSENIDVGDVDNDGDLDVIVGNGGDFGNEPNRIFINNGGLQGGTLGTFTEGTSTRFAGVPNDTARDIEFADFDNDGDLDVYVSNRGSNTAGQVSRAYINQGGIQGGTIGFYQEDSNNFWRTLVSVPGSDQVFGGNNGPWEDWSCDCEFADLDNDGDNDLFHSSYGPSVNASTPSRVFLNNGAGRFDELFPWLDAGGDASTHTFDVDIIDLDGDFDFDIVNSSRDSQARIYISNLYNPTTGSTQLYTDTTFASLLATGSAVSGSSNYEGEVGDVDGDGDFDSWMKNYQSFTDKILVNNGTDANGAVLFQESDNPGPNMIRGDPNVDENEVDFLDFDGDGDLDAFLANFSGTNAIYVGGNAQGLTGQYHNSTGQGDSNYPQNETPSSANGGTTLDGEVGDMDNDGDFDLLLANDSNQSNRYWQNTLGIPDTHAPEITDARIATGLEASGIGGTVVNAQLRDNAPYYLIQYYDVDLTYQPGNVTIDMFSQGAQQFRADVPASATSFTVSATDLAGNTAVSNVQILGGGPSPYTDLGCADGGALGDPLFVGTGTLLPGSAGSLNLSNAANVAPSAMFAAIGPGGAGAPFKGGVLKAVPVIFTLAFTTNVSGEINIPFTTPGGLTGASVVVQWAISDGTASSSTALSNALQLDFQ